MIYLLVSGKTKFSLKTIVGFSFLNYSLPNLIFLQYLYSCDFAWSVSQMIPHCRYSFYIFANSRREESQFFLPYFICSHSFASLCSRSFAFSLTEAPYVTMIQGQSCEMSNLLHGSNLLNQILPQEKRVNRDKFSTQKE